MACRLKSLNFWIVIRKVSFELYAVRIVAPNGVRVIEGDFGGVRGPTGRPSVPLTSGSCLWRCRMKSRGH